MKINDANFNEDFGQDNYADNDLFNYRPKITARRMEFDRWDFLDYRVDQAAMIGGVK